MKLVTMIVATLALAAPALAGGRKAAEKLLHQIEQVDGAGSGLDADTVRGMTPDAIAAQVQANFAQALSHISLVSTTTSVEGGFCDCADAACPEVRSIGV